MWQIMHFKTIEEQHRWMERNYYKFQMAVLFVNNGYAVEYRKLRVIG